MRNPTTKFLTLELVVRRPSSISHLPSLDCLAKRSPLKLRTSTVQVTRDTALPIFQKLRAHLDSSQQRRLTKEYKIWLRGERTLRPLIVSKRHKKILNNEGWLKNERYRALSSLSCDTRRLY